MSGSHGLGIITGIDAQNKPFPWMINNVKPAVRVRYELFSKTRRWLRVPDWEIGICDPVTA